MTYSKSISLILLLMTLLCGCGKSPEDARKDLGQMGIQFDGRSFLKAAKNGDLLAVRLFLDAGMDVNIIPGDDMHPALIMAAGSGHTEIVKLLMERGADVNLRGDEGMTALFAATAAGHTEIVKLFIDKGADVNAKVYGWKTILVAAKKPEIVDMLKAAGAKEK